MALISPAAMGCSDLIEYKRKTWINFVGNFLDLIGPKAIGFPSTRGTAKAQKIAGKFVGRIAR
jgi:hypothetical protein